MKNKADENKHKETWGHVEPGPLSEGEKAALEPLQENAARSENVKPTNMDPEPSAGDVTEPSKEEEEEEEERTQRWQQLSPEERKKFEGRKDGFPKN